MKHAALLRAEETIPGKHHTQHQAAGDGPVDVSKAIDHPCLHGLYMFIPPIYGNIGDGWPTIDERSDDELQDVSNQKNWENPSLTKTKSIQS